MIRHIVDMTTRRFFCVSTMGLCLAAIALCSQLASAATISYGDFGPVPPGVSFLEVEESSGTDPVPLYGAPTPFSVGLDFDPANFVSTTSDGGADISVGQLNFTVMSDLGIATLDLFESGDYTLEGNGTAVTEVGAGAILHATVTEINGVGVAPIILPPVNSSVGFDLAANSGVAQPWSLGLALNVGAHVAGATKVEVVVDNSLLSVSEASSIAFISKTDFSISAEPIPEPATIALASAGATMVIGLLLRRRGD